MRGRRTTASASETPATGKVTGVFRLPTVTCAAAGRDQASKPVWEELRRTEMRPSSGVLPSLTTVRK